MIFGHKELTNEICVLIKIEKVKETMFLGVVIDEKLTWKAQIKYVFSKSVAPKLFQVVTPKTVMKQSGTPTAKDYIKN